VVSWEQKTNVMGAFLHTDLVYAAWALGLRNIQPYGMPFIPYTGMPYDMARNCAVMDCLRGGYSHLFFLDSDVIPPSNVVYRLLKHNKPIISGLYYRRSPPHGAPVMIRNGTWFTNYVPGSTVEVDMVGAGCLLLSREFLEHFPAQRPGHHWFNWTVNFKNLKPLPVDIQEHLCLSEDFTFNVWAKEKMGISTWVDTSIECRHCGAAQAVRGGMVPLETTPVT
jgi:hypothetical protein